MRVFRTYEADHGDAAIAMLPEYARTITLLFSDVDMPGDTNGFALAHTSRRITPGDRHRQRPTPAEGG